MIGVFKIHEEVYVVKDKIKRLKETPMYFPCPPSILRFL